MNAPLKAELLKDAAPYRRVYLPIRAKFVICRRHRRADLDGIQRSHGVGLDAGPFGPNHTIVRALGVDIHRLRAGLHERLSRKFPTTRQKTCAAKSPSYPGVTILIAAYNEEAGIGATLESIAVLTMSDRSRRWSSTMAQRTEPSPNFAGTHRRTAACPKISASALARFRTKPRQGGGAQ